MAATKPAQQRSFPSWSSFRGYLPSPRGGVFAFADCGTLSELVFLSDRLCADIARYPFEGGEIIKYPTEFPSEVMRLISWNKCASWFSNKRLDDAQSLLAWKSYPKRASRPELATASKPWEGEGTTAIDLGGGDITQLPALFLAYSRLAVGLAFNARSGSDSPLKLLSPDVLVMVIMCSEGQESGLQSLCLSAARVGTKARLLKMAPVARLFNAANVEAGVALRALKAGSVVTLAKVTVNDAAQLDYHTLSYKFSQEYPDDIVQILEQQMKAGLRRAEDQLETDDDEWKSRIREAKKLFYASMWAARHLRCARPQKRATDPFEWQQI